MAEYEQEKKRDEERTIRIFIYILTEQSSLKKNCRSMNII